VSRLREIPTDELGSTASQPPPQATQQVGLQLLLLALKALSERFVVALYGIRDVVLAGSVFWLSLAILPKPDIYQLVGLALYGLFILAIVSLLRRR
jgi:hypothetical protein